MLGTRSPMFLIRCRAGVARVTKLGLLRATQTAFPRDVSSSSARHADIALASTARSLSSSARVPTSAHETGAHGAADDAIQQSDARRGVRGSSQLLEQNIRFPPSRL